MTSYVLSFKPAIGNYGGHDPSAVIFKDGNLKFGVEEERLNRQKHAVGCFPINAIGACLDYCNIALDDLDRILIPYDPRLQTKIIKHNFGRALQASSIPEMAYQLNEEIIRTLAGRFYPLQNVRQELQSAFQANLPPIELREHHACHAASAFHPSGFDAAVVLTIDGKGEYDSTVIWEGSSEGVSRIKTYKFPNSLGHFFGAVTEFLGFRAHNGEGKVMGLAPYGDHNTDIDGAFREVIEIGADYDVTEITSHGKGISSSVEILEEIFGRDRKTDPSNFTSWEQDLAYTAQSLLEEIVVAIVEDYCAELNLNEVCLSGGVALNCKMNKRIMELPVIDRVYIQPVSHDSGLAVGAGMLESAPAKVNKMTTTYLGPEYTSSEISEMLDKNKVEYYVPDSLESHIAEKIAAGGLIGWFQGRLEMGPRALGNRSILADPRSEESRDRVNEFVKHREKWRPFAPSMTLEAADDYLVNAEDSSFMIKTFDTNPDNRDDIEAVVHPSDWTTRPQTVTEDQNPRYHKLISEFEAITGVPVVLNTSFNDHGEPIVNKPVEALKDFFGMGLDYLVLEDFVIPKKSSA